jgi:hypothetical protein
MHHSREHSDVRFGIQVSVLAFLFLHNSDEVLRTYPGSVVPKLLDVTRSLHEVYKVNTLFGSNICPIFLF